MERYRIIADPSNLPPIHGRLGVCSSRATVYPDDNNQQSKPRQARVLVDTGAEVTIIGEKYIPENATILSVPSLTVTGFGDGSAKLDRRVQLKKKLHGDDESNGIDVLTTAYVMKETASGLGIELGTNVMKPLSAVVDIARSVLRVTREDGKAFEAPIHYLQEEDKMESPDSEKTESPASEHTVGTEDATRHPQNVSKNFKNDNGSRPKF